MKAYDIDGVISIGHKPTKDDIILSGRGYDYYQQTIKDLEKWGVTEYLCLILAPYKQEWMAGKSWVAGAWKAEMINRLGITEYYEDDPAQYEVIKNNCPNCNIIKI